MGFSMHVVKMYSYYQFELERFKGLFLATFVCLALFSQFTEAFKLFFFSYFCHSCINLDLSTFIRGHMLWVPCVNNLSKTCVKRLLSKRQKIGFQYQLSLNAGQKYCRMLQWDHSAILSTFIKLHALFVIKIFDLSFLSGRFSQVLLYSYTLIIFFKLDILDCARIKMSQSLMYTT